MQRDKQIKHNKTEYLQLLRLGDECIHVCYTVLSTFLYV